MLLASAGFAQFSSGAIATEQLGKNFMLRLKNAPSTKSGHDRAF